MAKSLVNVSRQLGITTTATITEMDNPLGRAVGNTLEVNRNFILINFSFKYYLLKLCVYLTSISFAGNWSPSLSQRNGTNRPWRISCDPGRTFVAYVSRYEFNFTGFYYFMHKLFHINDKNTALYFIFFCIRIIRVCTSKNLK